MNVLFFLFIWREATSRCSAAESRWGAAESRWGSESLENVKKERNIGKVHNTAPLYFSFCIKTDKSKKIKKNLDFSRAFLYTNNCCDIDSVEARGCRCRTAGFPWSECQVKETGDKSLYPQLSPPVRVETTVCKHQDTHG